MLAFARNIDPQASFPAYRARAVDLESHAVCWNGGRAEVDVWQFARQIGRAVVLERQEVDGVVVGLVRRHGVCCELKGRDELGAGVVLGPERLR